MGDFLPGVVTFVVTFVVVNDLSSCKSSIFFKEEEEVDFFSSFSFGSSSFFVVVVVVVVFASPLSSLTVAGGADFSLSTRDLNDLFLVMVPPAVPGVVDRPLAIAG